MGIAERRDRERKRRIEEIISAAKHIFLVKGFSGTTMNDIADHSELSRRTLYHYFRSKEELSLTAAAETLEQLLEQVELVHRAAENGIGRLQMTLEIYRRMFETDPGGFQFIIGFPESLNALGRDNAQVIRCLAQIDRIVQAISRFIREGMDDGSVRKVPNPSKTAAILVSMVHGAIQNVVTDNDIVRIATSCPSDDFLSEIFSLLNDYISPSG